MSSGTQAHSWKLQSFMTVMGAAPWSCGEACIAEAFGGDVTHRIQLSMYVPEPAAHALEAVRRVLDPVQCRLIPAHVTLCREDELSEVGLDVLASRLTDVRARPLTLQFGRPEVFHEHGVLLPCIAGEQAFRLLRERLLGSRSIRYQAPHITLAHPRNPKAAGNCLANANVLPAVVAVTFASVNLIEQTGTAAWRVLHSFALDDSAEPSA